MQKINTDNESIITGLNNKSDIDMKNINEYGVNTLTSFITPSGKFDILDTTNPLFDEVTSQLYKSYIASENGYFFAWGKTNMPGDYQITEDRILNLGHIYIINRSMDNFDTFTNPVYSGWEIYCYLPVRKDDIIEVRWRNLESLDLKFYYIN